MTRNVTVAKTLGPKFTIVNIVATADLGQPINLARLANCKGFLYSSSVYRGLCAYLKDAETLGKVTIFATGKMIGAGSKSFSAAKHDLNYAAKKLGRLGLISPPRTIQVKLRNMVATSELGVKVNLDKLGLVIPHVMYEPEQFPAAIYFAPELEGTSILIFGNGKLVFAGLRSKDQIATARTVLKNISETLSSFEAN